MSSTTKDYSDVNRLALGHITHEQLAQKLLQQTRSSEELMSVLRAGHDRIQYFLCGKPVAQNEEAVSITIGGVEEVSTNEAEERKRAYEISSRDSRIQALEVEVGVLTGNLKNAENALTTANSVNEQLTTALQEEQASAELQRTEFNSNLAELEKVQTELTTAYMAKQVAEDQVKTLQAKLDDIAENYEIEEDAETETASTLADAADTSNDTYYVPSKPELKEIALKHGFRVRQQSDGKEDLNDYVYATIYDGIKLSHERS